MKSFLMVMFYFSVELFLMAIISVTIEFCQIQMLQCQCFLLFSVPKFNVTVLAPYVFKLCWLWSISVFSSAWLWTSYIVRAKEPLSLFIFFVSL